MRRRQSMVLALGVLVGITCLAPLAAQKPSKQTDTEIRTTFRDDASDTMRSDGLAYQTDSQLKTQNVLLAGSEANYILETFTAASGTAVRCVYVDLAQVVARVSGESIPVPGCADVRFSTHSFFMDSKDSLRDMSFGQIVPKRLAFGWQSGQWQYTLRFKGEAVDVGDGSGSHELGNVGFTCTATSAAGCTAWTAQPIRCVAVQASGAYNSYTNCAPNSLAVLERASTKGNATPVMIAVIDIPFVMNVARR